MFAAWVSVDDGVSTVVSVTVEKAGALDAVDAIVVVTILELWEFTTDVAVLVRVGGDEVSVRIAVKLAVAAESSDLADDPSKATLELALTTAAPADSVATAITELARATMLLASEAASDTSPAASELACRRTL